MHVSIVLWPLFHFLLSLISSNAQGCMLKTLNFFTFPPHHSQISHIAILLGSQAQRTQRRSGSPMYHNQSIPPAITMNAYESPHTQISEISGLLSKAELIHLEEMVWGICEPLYAIRLPFSSSLTILARVDGSWIPTASSPYLYQSI